MNTCPVCNNPISPNDTVCPSCGFKLTGRTQEFKPITQTSNPSATDAMRRVPPEAHPQASAKFIVVQGPQTGASMQLENHPMTIGRNPQCDIFLNDMTVSRKHATLVPKGSDFQITDTGSFNGIWVNNQNVETAHLHPGDIIQIGAFVLKYQH